MVVVGGLLVAALVVGLVLWVTMGTDGTAPDDDAATTVLPDQGGSTAPTVAPVPGAGIVAVRTFDPDGDGSGENDDRAPLAIDGNLDTAWQTVCYGDKYLGGKGGVGLVADLGANHTGTFTVALGSAPYQLRVYTAADGQNPTTFDEWGTPRRYSGEQADTITVDLSQPVRYVLVSFVQLGENNGCTTNPYRGSIRELTFG
jgi:hypothetical protein